MLSLCIVAEKPYPKDYPMDFNMHEGGKTDYWYASPTP